MSDDIEVTAPLRNAILKAAELAGGKGGIVAYLEKHAATNPIAAKLLGKVLVCRPVKQQRESVNAVQEGAIW